MLSVLNQILYFYIIVIRFAWKTLIMLHSAVHKKSATTSVTDEIKIEVGACFFTSVQNDLY